MTWVITQILFEFGQEMPEKPAPGWEFLVFLRGWRCLEGHITMQAREPQSVDVTLSALQKDVSGKWNRIQSTDRVELLTDASQGIDRRAPRMGFVHSKGDPRAKRSGAPRDATIPLLEFGRKWRTAHWPQENAWPTRTSMATRKCLFCRPAKENQSPIQCLMWYCLTFRADRRRIAPQLENPIAAALGLEWPLLSEQPSHLDESH
jgi:hypothetical protein